MKRLRPPSSDADDDASTESEYNTNTIYQPALCSIVRFYDRNEHVQSARQQLVSRVFNGNFTFFCGITNEEKDEVPIRPGLLNSKSFLDEHQVAAVRANDYVRMFGGFAAWAVCDLDQWLYYYSNETTVAGRRELGMPYGVLDAWEYSLRLGPVLGRSYRIDVVPNAKYIAKGRRFECKYAFFNINMHLLPVNSTDLALFDSRADCYMTTSRGGANSLDKMRIPQSPFYSLNTQAEQLEATRINLADADFQSCHPIPFIRIDLQDAPAVQDIPEKEMYSSSSVVAASMRVRQEISKLNVQQMANIATSTLRIQGLIGERRQTPRDQQRQFYRYADAMDDVQILEQGMTLTHLSEPKTINSYENRLEELKQNIAAVMGLTDQMGLTGDKKKSGAANTGSKDQLSSHVSLLTEQRAQLAVVIAEQNMYAKISEFFFELAGFRDHDMMVVSDVIAELENLIESAQQRQKVGVPQQQRRSRSSTTQAIRDITTAPHKNEKEAAAAPDNDETLVKPLKIYRKQLKTWLERQQRNPQHGSLTIIFENLREGEEKLEYLTEMFKMGIMSAKALEKQARIVFNDDTITFQEPVVAGEGKSKGGAST